MKEIMTIPQPYQAEYARHHAEIARITLQLLGEAMGASETTAPSPGAKQGAEEKPAIPFARADGTKRSAEHLAQLTERLFEQIRAFPGERIEGIGAALQLTTKDLALPVKKLLAAKRIRTVGQKRATKYYPRSK